jgi:hypothetical protein
MYNKTNEEPEVRIENINKPEDREYYSDILVRLHYLKSSQLNRNTILHVAKRGGTPVAIITWEHRQQTWFALRDRLIGWTAEQKAQRIGYVVENRRFLMLTKEANLASAILAQSVARLNTDGEEKLGHGFILAETFVDPSLGFEGTCYKAAGWTEVGLSCGGRGRDTRSRKLYFVKPLVQDALAKLKHPEFSASDIINPRQRVLSLENIELESLKKLLEAIPDPRQRVSNYYPLASLLALMISAVLCGCSRLTEIKRWVDSLSLEVLRSMGMRKHPSYKLLWSTLSNVDDQALAQALATWLEKQTKILSTVTPALKVLSLDGKALRAGAKTLGTELHLLTLIDSISQVVRAQVRVPEKTNEIPVARQLLDAQPLDATTVITADALHTQVETAAATLKKTLITSSPSKIIKKI